MSKNKIHEQTELFESKKDPEQTTTANKVNLLDVAANEAVESSLEVVRLGSDETAIIPFTSDGEAVNIHYCSETEISGYVRCNGPDCVLCRIGRKRDPRLLLPVYLPTAGCVGVLPVSRSLRPYSLLPQLLNVLKAEQPLVMFVTRNMAKYMVSTAELQKDIDGGEAAIKRFLDDYDAGNHDLTAVYQLIDNEDLSSVEEIGKMISLKGIRLDDSDKRP